MPGHHGSDWDSNMPHHKDINAAYMKEKLMEGDQEIDSDISGKITLGDA